MGTQGADKESLFMKLWKISREDLFVRKSHHPLTICLILPEEKFQAKEPSYFIKILSCTVLFHLNLMKRFHKQEMLSLINKNSFWPCNLINLGPKVKHINVRDLHEKCFYPIFLLQQKNIIYAKLHV